MHSDPLLQILRRLSDHGVEFVVVGGMAAVALGSVVITRDVDVCISFDAETLRKVATALDGINPRLRFRPDLMPMPRNLHEIKNLRNLNLVTDLGVIDFLDELEGIGDFHALAGRTITLELGGVRCRVLDLDTLIIAKRKAGRPKDLEHARQLEAAREMRQRQPGLFDDVGPG